MKKLINYPTFLVIGAQKCGTTWLSQMVSQHPEVAVTPKKELHFFDHSSNYRKGLEWYRNQFSGTPSTKAVGEFTPNYFWTSQHELGMNKEINHQGIPELVHESFPNIQLIVSLRNPVNRAISAYYHHIRNGRITPKMSLSQVMGQYGLISMGYYDVHLTNWMKFYSSDNFLILIYEEDIQDEKKHKTLENVFRHIGVNDKFNPTGIYSKYAIRSSPFEMRIKQYPSIIKKGFRRIIPESIKESDFFSIPVSEKEKDALREIFKPHNRNLEKMIKRKIPWK
jgi:hypothetical protein